MLQIRSGHLPGALALTADAVRGELRFCRRIDRIVYFLRGHRRRGDIESAAQTGLFDHIFKYKFSHRRSADVAVADEQYIGQQYVLLIFYRERKKDLSGI